VIRRLALALVVCLHTVAPAAAFEVLANGASWTVFAKAAQATGFADAKGAPITQGPLGKDGSWFYNAVGDVSVPTGKTITCAGPGGQLSRNADAPRQVGPCALQRRGAGFSQPRSGVASLRPHALPARASRSARRQRQSDAVLVGRWRDLRAGISRSYRRDRVAVEKGGESL